MVAPAVAEQAVSRLAEVLEVHRSSGPRPSRTSPELVRYYLSGRLRPTGTAALQDKLARLQAEAALLREALAVVTCCDHGQGLDYPDCEPVPGIVRAALSNDAGIKVLAELQAARAVVEVAHDFGDDRLDEVDIIQRLSAAVDAYDCLVQAQGGER